MITESLKVWKNLIFNVNKDMTVAVVITNQAPAPTPSQPRTKKKLGVSGGCEPMASLLAPHCFTN